MAPSGDMRTHKPAFDLKVSAVRLWHALMTYGRVTPNSLEGNVLRSGNAS